MVSAWTFSQGFKKALHETSSFGNQDILISRAGLSDAEEIEVQKLRGTCGVNLFTERGRNPGATHKQSADEANLEKGFDLGIQGSSMHLNLDDLCRSSQVSMVFEIAVCRNSNSTLSVEFES